MLSNKLSKCISFSRQAIVLSNTYLSRAFGKKTSTMSSNPSTLKDFGYAFNEAGQLRQIDPENNSLTERPYEFEFSSKPSENQARYEAIGEIITEEVYKMLLDLGLHKIYVPSPESPDSSFVFGTKTNFENTKKLLFLIHGSGVVRAGQWSRSLIINHSIDHGTQIPYIKKAIELGYDVLVTNTNHNYRVENKKRIALEGNSSPEAHIISVWDQLIAPVFDTIESFAVVAHSYGGVVTLEMAGNYPDEFLSKCFAVGFTDSVHYSGGLDRELLQWFRQNARNFVTSSKPLNEELDRRSKDIPCYSAGHTKHEWTSWACIDALFPFIEEKYEEFMKSMENKNDEADGSKHAASLHEDDINQEAKKGKFEEIEQDKQDEVVEDKDDAAEDKNFTAKEKEDNSKKHEDL